MISLNKHFISLFFDQFLISSGSPIWMIIDPVFVEMNDMVGTYA